MASKKYRTRKNPLKPVTGSLALATQYGKPLEEFTGEGEEAITGEGGGVLRFMDGRHTGSTLPHMAKQFSHEETARLLRLDGSLGFSVESYRRWNMSEHIPEKVLELLSIPEIAILAASLIEAIHGGDAEALHRVAAITANPGHYEEPIKEYYLKSKSPLTEHPCVFHSRDSLLVWWGVCEAARRAEQVPTREEVRDVLADIFEAKNKTKRFPAVIRSDKLQKMLVAVGFGWLPHRKQGEHLKNPQYP